MVVVMVVKTVVFVPLLLQSLDTSEEKMHSHERRNQLLGTSGFGKGRGRKNRGKGRKGRGELGKGRVDRVRLGR